MSEARCRQQWQHTSSLMALLVNINRDPKKGKTAKPADFNPYEVRTAKDDRVARVSILKLKGMFSKKKPGPKKTKGA